MIWCVVSSHQNPKLPKLMCWYKLNPTSTKPKSTKIIETFYYDELYSLLRLNPKNSMQKASIIKTNPYFPKSLYKEMRCGKLKWKENAYFTWTSPGNRQQKCRSRQDKEREKHHEIIGMPGLGKDYNFHRWKGKIQWNHQHSDFGGLSLSSM